jgi:hemolysin activation/secretion protein
MTTPAVLLRLHRKILLMATLLVLCFVQVHAVAQVPETAGVGQLQRQFNTQPQPQSKPPIERVPQQPSLPLIQNDGQTFLIKSIDFNTTKVIPHEMLQKRVAIFINQPVTAAYVNIIAEALTEYVRAQGFMVSRVIVPPQKIQKGVLRLQIIEQGIAEVIFKGDTRLTESSILKNIRARLLADVPLKQSTLEQALLSLNRLAGVSATATLFAMDGDNSGLKITINQNRIDGIISLDNRGSRFVGPWQASVGSNINGVFSPFDQLFIRGIKGTDNQELSGAESNYQMPLNSLGTSLKLSVLRVWSEPGYTLQPSRLENVSSTYGIGIKHPLVQERSLTISVDTQFNIRNAGSKTFGTYISDDKTRSLTTGLTIDTANATGGSTFINTSFSQGFNILGARKSGGLLLSRANGRSDFSKIETYIARTQALTENNSVQFIVNGQYALTQLLSGEEFAYGGSQFGRGYGSSEITGDHGIAALVELQHRPNLQAKYVNNPQFYASYDFGSVWAIDTETRFDKRTAASAALGVRFDVTRRFSIDTQLAKPLTRPISEFNDSSSNNPRGFVSGTVQF